MEEVKNTQKIDHVVYGWPHQAEEAGGCIIFGLYIEGARWNEETKRIDEAKPKVFYEKLPPVCLEPTIGKD